MSYRVPVTTAVTKPTLVYRPAVTTARAARAVVVQRGAVAVAPTVRVVAPRTAVLAGTVAPVEPAENIVMEPGTELEELTVLREGDNIEPEDIVMPVDVVAEPETVVAGGDDAAA